MNTHEANILRKLEAKGYSNFPKMIDSGILGNKPYIKMQKLGPTLEELLTTRIFNYG